VGGGGYMVKLYTVKEMLDLEKEANASGMSYEMMMENAGKSLADEIEIAYSHEINKNILALVGPGNNGGDALVALDYLAANQWTGYAYFVKPRADNDPLVQRFITRGGQVIRAEGDPDFKNLSDLLNHCNIVVDGIFGTGIKLPLKGEVAKILAFCKNSLAGFEEKKHIVAVDCPSGIDCETGDVAEETIQADLTVTMAGIKSGMINTPATHYLGKLRIGNIGQLTNLIAYQQNNKYILLKEIIRGYLPERSVDAHKGTFGTALIIAGSINYTGAALLSGMAAYRSGAGLVTMAVPSPLHAALAGHFLEATWILLPDEMGVISKDAAKIITQSLSRATAILIGPGFGLEDPTKEFIQELLSSSNSSITGDMGFIHKTEPTQLDQISDKPIVMDADGLKLLSKIKNWSEALPPGSILTPHPGEMSVLTGLSTDQIQTNRVEVALEYSHKWGHIVVLKGAYTIIAAPDGRLAVVPIASSALARAGTGDVLAGLIVGLRAQGVNAFEAACAGAWIHATAGVLAAERLGNTASVIAGDVLSSVPAVISSL
jgi:ADP-dependent NAD(P)H-hydrate dehydratase / NAD(P)H-hydrate epimerase